ncbi:MetQ/NlpA family ABC transporter substrate-binding protein [Leptospira ellisii]|uniref:Lipoprotein n=2 Tax=Leptospira ellisii TaxID=2023197 RepID=A0AAE4QRC9_9LEPT|nr:MetQ/NlpA family ABC transporter substrate-binding protein [Leptospira ellisii]MDV6237566.1 MetQ/NlpA family ABC transporter substrate-binding protein [Leptospira ellisii]PKA02915.1 metal ABC transporter substrate-binding protein [Leptospira ellisii]
MKFIRSGLILLSVAVLFTVCKKSANPSLPGDRKSLKIGICPGPYGDLLKKAVFPNLEKKGYKLEIVEFSDYIQPNLALENGDIDANLFQHAVYLGKFSKDKNLNLASIVSVPTAPMAIFAGKSGSVQAIPVGGTVTLPNDPTNQLRALKLFQELGLLKVSPDANPAKASLADVIENPKKLDLKPLEAAQLPRSLQSAEVAAVNGNFAIASGLDLTKALKLESLAEEHKNIIVVRANEKDAVFAKDIVESVYSPEFEKTIDADFRGFQKPDWLLKRK